MTQTEASTNDLSDFTADKRVLLLSACAVLIGAISAFVAKLLVWLIALITNLSFFHTVSAEASSPAQNHLGLWVILVPVAGALVIGLMARFGSDKIRGHGIPEALEAILLGRSRMDWRVAILKPISSALSIGTGGPFGAEGPIIMTGGACGSLFAQLIHVTAAERKTLLVAGAAAGMSAIFNTPVAAVLLAVELMLFEWKPRSFIPVAVASAVAALLRADLFGSGPLFPIAPHGIPETLTLMSALVLGLAAGVGSALLTTLVYACEDFFERLPIHWMWWPALGAVVVGAAGYLDPRVLGVGYEHIYAMLQGQMLGAALAGLLVGKMVVWSVALGSGTSGGVLAPLLIMGGALGGILGRWLPGGDSGLWAMLGMAAMMGGTMRSPLTAMVFALELTHDLNALPSLMVSSVAAFGVTVLFLKRSILTEKLARRGHHISREYSIDLFETLRVKEVMDPDPPKIQSVMKVAELSDMIIKNHPALHRRQASLIMDAQDRLVGIITRGDVLRAVQNQTALQSSVLEAGTAQLIVTHPDELLSAAVDKMLKNDLGRLPVVDPRDPTRPLGYLGRGNVIAARLGRLEEEALRERGLGAAAPSAAPAH